MKREHTNWFFALVVAGAVTVVSAPTMAGVESQTTKVSKAMAGVPVTELAAKAALLVKQAQSGEQKDVALAAVETVARLHPAAAKSVVSAIAKVRPDCASAVASKAAEFLPNESVELACAAAVGARQIADKVAAEMAMKDTKNAAEIADRVMLALPEQAQVIRTKVIEAVPSAASQIATVETSAAASGNDVAIVIVRKKPTGAPPTSASGQDTPGIDYARPGP